MRNILYVIVASLGLSVGVLSTEPEDAGIGEEYIEPLRYPKFSLSVDYGVLRKFHGFENSRLRANLPNNMAATLSFEAGLYRYLNAGALLSLNFPIKKQDTEPTHLRFALFAKPYFSITEQVSIFGRFGGGLSLSFSDYLLAYRKSSRSEFREFGQELLRTYSTQMYAPVPFGANLMASIGVEVFPLERVGLALEWGFRGDFLYARKSNWIAELTGNKLEEKILNAPSSLKYLVYEMPLMLTVHIIL